MTRATTSLARSARLATFGLGCYLSACASEARPEPGTAAESLFMDVHDLGAGKVTAEAVAEAHAKDLETQRQYGVSFERYWVDEANGKVYCLSRAPSAEAVVQTHRDAHGLIPDEVASVTQGE